MKEKGKGVYLESVSIKIHKAIEDYQNAFKARYPHKTVPNKREVINFILNDNLESLESKTQKLIEEYKNYIA